MPLHTSPRNRRPSISSVTLALFALALLVHVPGFRSEAHAANRKTMEGTWQLQVMLKNCDTGAVVAGPFTSLQTFSAGGSMIEQGSRIGPAPTSNRSVGQGVWKASGGGAYVNTFKFFRYDNTGAYLGYNEIHRTLQLGGNRDWFTSTGQTKIFDPAGNQVGLTCIEETGDRVSLD